MPIKALCSYGLWPHAWETVEKTAFALWRKRPDEKEPALYACGPRQVCLHCPAQRIVPRRRGWSPVLLEVVND